MWARRGWRQQRATMSQQRLLSLHLAMRRTALADAWARWRSAADARAQRDAALSVAFGRWLAHHWEAIP